MTSQPEPTPGKRAGAVMIIMAWIVVLAMLTLYFKGWFDQQHNPNTSVTGRIGDDGLRELVLRQNRQGHYIAEGKINDHTVVFLLDTGATEVSVPEPVALRLGLTKGQPARSNTANGTITTFSTRLDSVALGPVEQRNVRAHINPHMHGEEILLGMSFLRRLDLRQRDGKLTITQMPR